MSAEQANFEGWAVIELFGHSREVGYVSTEHFGTGALFRVEVPALPEREVILERPQWIEGELAGVGSKMMRSGVEGRTRFIGPGAVYAMNPCTHDAAMKALEALSTREVKVIELVKPKTLVTANAFDEDMIDESDIDEARG
jgi:hypothetical protein